MTIVFPVNNIDSYMQEKPVLRNAQLEHMKIAIPEYALIVTLLVVDVLDPVQIIVLVVLYLVSCKVIYVFWPVGFNSLEKKSLRLVSNAI